MTVAGSSLAFVQIPLAVVTSEPRRAVALVTAHAVFTLSSILTERLQRARLGGTVIHVKFTLESYDIQNRQHLICTQFYF